MDVCSYMDYTDKCKFISMLSFSKYGSEGNHLRKIGFEKLKDIKLTSSKYSDLNYL